MKPAYPYTNAVHSIVMLALVLGFSFLNPLPTEALKPGDNLNLEGGTVEGIGYINPADTGDDFTNTPYRTMAISIGQLGGVDPETGHIIVTDQNLLPLVAQSLDVIGSAYFYTNIYISGNTYVHGVIYGSGAGITNLPAQAISGSLVERPEIQSALETKLDATGVWESIDASSAVIADLQSIVDALNASIADTNNPHQVTTAQIGALSVSGGTMTGPIDMGGATRIVNLPDPANDQDAVSKAYLERRLTYFPPQGDLSMGIYTNSP